MAVIKMMLEGDDTGAIMPFVQVESTLSEIPGSAPESVPIRSIRLLVDRHWELIGRILRNCGVPEAELDDALQQVFWSATRRLDDIRPGSERPFLVQIAVHVAARARRARARSRIVVDGLAREMVDPNPDGEQALARKRALAQLDMVLDAMSFELRSVFVLYEVEELTMAEIAASLEIPPGTVASRLRRARTEFETQVKFLNEEGDI